MNASILICVLFAAEPSNDWPQWLGSQRDGVWRETGLLDKFPKEGPKILWRTPIGGGYAGPAVVGDRVYITDRVLNPGQADPDNPFRRANSEGKERLLCLNAKTGKEIWKHEYDCKYTMAYPCGPRATPVIQDGKVWTLGAMGDLHCLDAATGKLVWSKNLIKDYDATVPVWGFAAHLLIDGDNVITLAGRNPVVVALNKNTGKETWRALKIEAAEIGYCPPMIYNFGGKRQLIIWHPEAVNGLDPATGKVNWSHDWNVRSNLTVPTPRKVGDKLFLTSFYNGCQMLKVGADKAEVLWRSKGRGEQPNQTDKLHSIMPTPVIQGDYIYGIDSYGELRCLDMNKEGQRVWTNLTATGTGGKTERWANAFLIPNGDRFFLFNEKGELIIAKLTPKGYEEISRAKVLDPTGQLGGGFANPRKVVWSHPAFSNKVMFARNDKEIIAVSLAAE